MKKSLIFLTLLGIFPVAKGQKVYSNSSVLSTGQWIKFSVEMPGVYKCSASDLKSFGITGAIPSTQLRLFGNGGTVLPESNAANTIDDLRENAIEVFDGGDESFEGNDYFLFYAPGPHQWLRNNTDAGFSFQKNPYTDRSFYFLQIGSSGGKRISEKIGMPANGMLITSFDEHLHHELDTINFLKSGKEWYGEQFSATSGTSATREFNFNINTALAGEQVLLTSDVIGSSAGFPNKIAVSVNGKKMIEHTTDPIPGSLISPVASESRLSSKDILTGSGLVVNYQHTGGSINAKSWLNWFDVYFKRKLDLAGLSQLQFRLKDSTRRSYNFTISNAQPTALVWDVTDPDKPRKIKTSSNGTGINFYDTSSGANEYIVFDPSKPLAPTFIGKIDNQNLHQLKSADLVIVAEQSFLAQARRLSDFHVQHDGLTSMVIDIDHIYNEFSSGAPDPTAVRNFLKMFYDRSLGNPSLRPKYLMLFGSASYVIKEKTAKKNSLVPSYQTANSLDPLLSYVTDDYFGLLDDGDDINLSKNIPLLDVAIGRIPVRTLDQARKVVDKIIRYTSSTAIGPWRNNITFVADDEDYNLHIDDAEAHAALIQQTAPQLQTNKIYLDAFKQESNAGGSRYPDVSKEVLKDIQQGTLIWNYSGHGNNTRLAYEVVLDKDLLAQWKNESRLPLFITATCDFAPFDDQTQFSLGEDLFIGRNTGAIGLVTTTRLVFASSNKLMNNNYLAALTARNQQGLYPTLGQALKEAKNTTYLNSTDFVNVRKFTLLGDPALALAMPVNKIKTTSIQSDGSSFATDTLKAMNKYSVSGEVVGPDGKSLTTFNGNIYPTLYDKEITQKTLGNDADSRPIGFGMFENILFKGKAKVEAGKFSFAFIVPKDISYPFGAGKLLYYAENGISDASGVDQTLIIGGTAKIVSSDNKGPEINAYLDTAAFKNGNELGTDPVLYVQLSDPSGLNLSQSSIGHQMIAVLDKKFDDAIVLNDYYVPEAEGKGNLIYPFSDLSEGRHTLMIRAWDVLNNSSTVELEFVVKKSPSNPIKSMTAYPNPYYNKTNLNVELDLDEVGYRAELGIFSMEGKMLSNMTEEIKQTGLQSILFEWDGKTASGQSLQKGMYFARLILVSKQGKNVSKMLKLIKL